jgi:putative hydrolase of the HAD superfamily
LNFQSAASLLVDADDTLWENNIYFERVIRSVQDMLLPLGVFPDSFRDRLNDNERRHIVTHGYGTVNFTRSLLMTFESFLPRGPDPALTARVEAMSLGILDHPIELIDGVKETLAYLADRHSLYLVTKGERDEQAGKLEASGLRMFFGEIEILREKNEGAFRGLIGKYGLDPERTWMIGNSTRSDIHPALAAGIHAIFIPHQHTWELEHEEPVRHPRLIELERFTHLKNHF